MYPQSSKFWRASDSFFNTASSARGIGRSQSGRPYSFDMWREWLRRSRQPDRKKRIQKFIGGEKKVVDFFRGVDSRLTRLNPNREVAIAIRTDPKFRQNIMDIAGSVGPIVTEQLDTALASLAFNAWRRWPTKTKLSKALLSLEYEVLPGNILQGSVRSNAWYSFYIKSFQNGLGGKQPYRLLMFQPSDNKIRKAAEAIAQNIDQYVKGARR